MNKKDKDFPKIICLCGSTRFTEQMLIKQWELTKQGCIVLSWCALPDSYFSDGMEDILIVTNNLAEVEDVEELVDEIHKRKIDLADEILVLNIDGYVGESTQSEIDYAFNQGVSVQYVEPLKGNSHANQNNKSSS